jgi:hypothetical protein
MSILNDKINSYAIETGIEFNEAYQLVPTQTGSITETNSTYWVKVGRDPVYESNVGPNGGSGSWKFVNNSTNGCYFRTSGGSIVSRINDQDFSSGVWIKFNELPTNVDASTTVMTIAPGATSGSNIGWKTFANGSTPRFIVLNSGVAFIEVADIQLNTWYYIASRRANNVLTYYINGQSVYSETRTSTANGSLIGWNNSSTAVTASVNISNFYMASSSVIGPTQIEEIYAAGIGINASYSATPATASALAVDPTITVNSNVDFTTTSATASALMTEPTIIITSNDYTEITTSITVSATFPSNISVVARKNINFTLATTFNASIELINNIIISTGSDDSFSAAEFIASAQMLPGKVAEVPMTASAIMPNPTVSVPLSYFKLVKDLNPYLYINNGEAAANIINYGYQPVTFTKGAGLSTLQDAGNPLNLVAEEKSWKGSDNSGDDDWLRITAPSISESFDNILGTGEFSIEFWVKTPSWLETVATASKLDFIKDPSLYFYYYHSETEYASVLPASLRIVIKNGPSSTYSIVDAASSNDQVKNTTYHYVLRSTKISSSQALIEVLRNGSILVSQIIPFTNWTSDKTTNYVIGGIIGTGSSSEGIASYYFDEIALYNFRLNNSQIINHHQFINTLSPNSINNTNPFTAYAEIGDHQFTVESNVNAIAIPITASALFVDPMVVARKNINYSASALTASATNTDAAIYYGWTIYPAPAIAATEMGPAYFLSSYYYQYIQSNFAPYRYVTFDSSAPYLDYGSDTDYSVANVVVNGTVVNPDFGINGKSVKSTGAYTNGAAILKESEHDDTWGTGNNSWHSAFWMRRALDDTSTGLRVLWNLNGYADNQNIIVYHYQNKLHVQINGQDDAAITISSANNVNIFDYERHHIVIKSHHNNNQNTLTLFVDGVQVATQNIGNYAVTTINGAPHIGPNDEANNFPRLGIGTLITPFGSTALPVVPSNISVYFDEVYWDKNDVTLTQVVNQFNAMPDQNNESILAEPFIASAQSVMPAISTQVILSVAPATASAEFVEPTLYVERFVVTTGDLMEASALMTEATAFVPVQINADVIIATAIFDNPGIIITIPGTTMYATALLKSQELNIKITSTDNEGFVSTNTIYPNTLMTPWLAYLRATEVASILPTREVV